MLLLCPMADEFVVSERQMHDNIMAAVTTTSGQGEEERSDEVLPLVVSLIHYFLNEIPQ